MCNKLYVNNFFVDNVQKSFNEATRSSIREYCGDILKFATDRVTAGRRSLSSIKSVIDTLWHLLVFKFYEQLHKWDLEIANSFTPFSYNQKTNGKRLGLATSSCFLFCLCYFVDLIAFVVTIQKDFECLKAFNIWSDQNCIFT